VGDVIGLIPARGGSTRVPRKALMHLGSAPLIEWTCASAVQSILLTRRVVITDDEEIAEYVRTVAEVHAEPPELATDSVHDARYIGQCATALGCQASDILVLLRPTSPFRRSYDIDTVIRMMQAQADLAYSVRSVRPALEYPEKAYTEENGMLRPLSLDNAANGPSQVLRRAWYPSGYIDAVRVYMVTEMGTLDGWRIGKFETPTERCVDIDTLENWAEAERIVDAHGWTPGDVE